jgi:hypothetical protein
MQPKNGNGFIVKHEKTNPYAEIAKPGQRRWTQDLEAKCLTPMSDPLL